MLTSPDVSPGVRPVERAGQACANATAARPTARAACWPGGWSRRACKFVTVYFAASIGGQSRPSGGWDTHGFNDKPMYPILNDYLLPITDQTLPTLLEDLRRARPARRHAGRLGGRVRPHAADQQHRRPRPLAAVLHGAAGRRRRQAAATSTAPATASAPIPRAIRCARGRSCCRSRRPAGSPAAAAATSRRWKGFGVLRACALAGVPAVELRVDLECAGRSRPREVAIRRGVRRARGRGRPRRLLDDATSSRNSASPCTGGAP